MKSGIIRRALSNLDSGKEKFNLQDHGYHQAHGISTCISDDDTGKLNIDIATS